MCHCRDSTYWVWESKEKEELLLSIRAGKVTGSVIFGLAAVKNIFLCYFFDTQKDLLEGKTGV